MMIAFDFSAFRFYNIRQIIQNMNPDKIPKIQVIVRKRPISKKQQFKNETDIIEVLPNSQTIIVREQKQKVDLTPYTDQYKFNFDFAYDQQSTNEQIYLNSIRPLVACAFDGARVSCFAYGQTGSGKTYTMLGNGGNVRGLYLIAAGDIFTQLGQFEKLTVWISFYEIYCGKLYDLLNERNILFARQDAKNNVNIVGLSERKITSVESLMQIIEFGTGVRVTAQNGTNVDSSRSHAILQITLKTGNKVHGKISFIDLAGSERAADHADQLQKQTRIDGAQINKSLLALKECIRALDQNKNHTPFRGSKLTMVLKDSFTGYCKTVMIGNISPNSSSCQNTLNTLKYADRVKQLKRPSKQINYMQMDNLDKLSKELMLPRQMINHTKIVKKLDVEEDNRENYYEYDYGTRNTNKPLEEPPLFTKSNKLPNQRPSTNSTSFHTKNSPHSKARQSPQINRYSNNSGSHRNNNSGYNYSNLVQQQEPLNFQESDKYRQPKYHSPSQKQKNRQVSQQQNHRIDDQMLNFEDLSKKHEGYIQLVIQEEEQLLKQHKQHINNQIELIKTEMVLMSQVDQIGSNIEDYLFNLENVLEKQLTSIFNIKQKVAKMRADLKESQRVEALYLKKNEQMMHHHGYNFGNNGDTDDLLADDDEHLFR